MRYFLILFFLLSHTLVSATTFYVSSSVGSDSNSGTAEAAPWKTIGKVNNMFGFVKPGDKILFRRGDTFYGQLKVTSSGASGSPITIGAYGTGEKPVITGFTTITNWKDEGNGIYSSVVNCESPPEMVTIDGVQYAMGRWPNGPNWATVDSHSGDISITDADLDASKVNWTGAEIVQRKACAFIMDRYKITNHIGTTISYKGDGKYPPANGWGYFIQNDLKTLDSFGEWYYNISSQTFYFFFGIELPTKYNVQMAAIDDLISFSPDKNYISISNIGFKGANQNAIIAYHNNNLSVTTCNIDFSGNVGIMVTSSQYLLIDNSAINHSNVSGIRLSGFYCHNGHITNNQIYNSGIIPGMGNFYKSGTGLSAIQGDNMVIENNQVINSGYCGIIYGGSGSAVRSNYIRSFCLKLEDGGGIYYGAQDESKNMLIENNIIIDAIGASEGKPIDYPIMAAGIYFDFNTTGGTKIKNNTIANSRWNGIYIHGSQNFEITGNTVFNISNCIKFQEYVGSTIQTRNIVMSGNIFFAKDQKQVPLRLNSTTNDFAQFGIFNYNFYAKPLDNSKPILPSINWSGTEKSLAEWQTLYKQDLNSKISPVTLTDTADIDFYYNETKSNKVFSLAKPMIDVKGTKYYNSITLLPFTSAVLMVDPNPAAPAVPVYSSSVIENVTPSLLQINFSLILANIVPAASAFTVTINSVARTVSSVAISGTKVTLTLASPVVSGDVVTVAYTKPATNPLQTSAGGLAASFTAKTVTNNVGALPVFVSATIENATPSLLQMNYSLSLSGTPPAASAFTVTVNSVARTVSSVAISGTKVTLTLSSPIIYGNVVTVSYTKPASNPLQTSSGGIAASITNQPVTNNLAAPSNIPPEIDISSPTKSVTFISPATITIEANPSDEDGYITKVEFYNGTTKLGERTASPYSFTWKDVTEGTYIITASATDNLNAKVVSGAVTVTVLKTAPAVNQSPAVSILSPGNNSSFETPAQITLTVEASDPDGNVSKVEYFNSSIKIGESLAEPYTFSFECSDTGKFEITAVATDNLSASTTSSPVNISVTLKSEYPDLIRLFPNPNDGHFTIDILSALPGENNRITIANLKGKPIYHDQITNEESTREIDLPNSVKSGIYVLMISNGNTIVTTKTFIKN